ncbi:MAG TPA: phosphomannomutase/phosphoglucomutase [Candidatus Saccharimonadales bacterium]|nr:phosphomannomutase/phosphoglucomutase [Candidatus Saccharimonadales bacterium]
MDESIFHAYDIRGIYPDQINETVVKRIAGAYAHHFQLSGKTVAVGHDVRLSSPKLKAAVINGLKSAGANVVDVGLVPTDVLYFAVASYGYAGGIQVTASHNPAQFNGLKILKDRAEVVIAETGLNEIRDLAASSIDFTTAKTGQVTTQDVIEDYLTVVAKFATFHFDQPLTVVANNNFGVTGPIAMRLLSHLKANIKLIELNFEPDGSFPKGRPDPLVPENRAETSGLVRREGAAMAVAWDADGDRCFFSDEHGEPLSGSDVTAMLAVEFLAKNPGEKILYDIRNVWAVEETVKAHGGVPLTEKVGHGFFKNRMRREKAIFAGELSGHFYFRDYFGLDNGLIPFLLFLNLVAKEQKSVSAIFRSLTSRYFASGEINFKVQDVSAAIKDVKSQFGDGQIDTTDGLSVDHQQWRFNLRTSNNENLLRLNVEARDEKTCLDKTNAVAELLEQHSQK